MRRASVGNVSALAGSRPGRVSIGEHVAAPARPAPQVAAGLNPAAAQEAKAQAAELQSRVSPEVDAFMKDCVASNFAGVPELGVPMMRRNAIQMGYLEKPAGLLAGSVKLASVKPALEGNTAEMNRLAGLCAQKPPPFAALLSGMKALQAQAEAVEKQLGGVSPQELSRNGATMNPALTRWRDAGEALVARMNENGLGGGHPLGMLAQAAYTDANGASAHAWAQMASHKMTPSVFASAVSSMYGGASGVLQSLLGAVLGRPA